MSETGISQQQRQALERHACHFWQRLRPNDLDKGAAADTEWLSACLQKRYHCTAQNARQQVSWFLAYFRDAA